MKRYTALLLLVCLAGCMPSHSRSVAIPETLAANGYRGPIVVSGYYFFHSEQDAIYQKPQSYGYYVLLQLAPILGKANITDWRARQKFMQSFDRQLVTVTGELKKEVFHVGGLVTGDPEVRTFVRVEKIKLANQPPLRMPVSGTPAADAPVAPPPGIAGR